MVPSKRPILIKTVSYELGTPVLQARMQGHLVHTKTPAPRTLQ